MNTNQFFYPQPSSSTQTKGSDLDGSSIWGEEFGLQISIQMTWIKYEMAILFFLMKFMDGFLT